MELAALIARCRQGDPLAWEVLVRRYQSRVLAIADAYVGDREEARAAARAHVANDPNNFGPDVTATLMGEKPGFMFM